jgi:hypothetical protein
MDENRISLGFFVKFPSGRISRFFTMGDEYFRGTAYKPSFSLGQTLKVFDVFVNHQCGFSKPH